MTETAGEQRTVTRRELDLQSDYYAALLLDASVRPDDFVSVRLPSTAEFVVACAAAWKVGATVQSLSHRFSLAEQRAVVELADSRIVLGATPAEFPGRTTIYADADLSGWARGRGHDSTRIRPPSPGRHRRPRAAPAGRRSSWPRPPLTSTPTPVWPRSSRCGPTQLVAGPLYHSAPFTYAMRGLMTGHALAQMPAFEPAAALGGTRPPPHHLGPCSCPP
ncbi:AMP-binding protein [Herbiconiux sp. VKM Ac-1786]|nr:AMP-binding protein [Herbiconiux sp. VKM Ac-1786]